MRYKHAIVCFCKSVFITLPLILIIGCASSTPKTSNTCSCPPSNQDNVEPKDDIKSEDTEIDREEPKDFEPSLQPKHNSFYRQGKNLGSASSKTAWNSINKQCQSIDQFFKIIDKSLALRTQRTSSTINSNATQSFALGYIDGLSTVANGIVKKCGVDELDYQSKVEQWKVSLLPNENTDNGYTQ